MRFYNLIQRQRRANIYPNGAAQRGTARSYFLARPRLVEAVRGLHKMGLRVERCGRAEWLFSQVQRDKFQSIPNQHATQENSIAQHATTDKITRTSRPPRHSQLFTGFPAYHAPLGRCARSDRRRFPGVARVGAAGARKSTTPSSQPSRCCDNIEKAAKKVVMGSLGEITSPNQPMTEARAAVEGAARKLKSFADVVNPRMITPCRSPANAVQQKSLSAADRQTAAESPNPEIDRIKCKCGTKNQKKDSHRPSPNTYHFYPWPACPRCPRSDTCPPGCTCASHTTNRCCSCP